MVRRSRAAGVRAITFGACRKELFSVQAPRQSRLRGLPGAEWAGSQGDFGSREGRVNGRPLSVTRDHWPVALQNRRQRALPEDALSQDAVLEGDGAVHARGKLRIVGGDQGGASGRAHSNRSSASQLVNRRPSSWRTGRKNTDMLGGPAPSPCVDPPLGRQGACIRAESA